MNKQMLNKLVGWLVNDPLLITNLDPYEMQRELLTEYFKSNPNFLIRLDYIDDVDHKVYLRQIITYFEEEILEFGDQYKKVVELILNNEQDEDKLQTEIWYMFEELADIYHFLLELLILSGISKEILENELKCFLKRMGVTSTNYVTDSFIYAGKYLTTDNDIWVNAGRDNPNMRFSIPEIRGCRKVSAQFLLGLETHLYRFTAFSKRAARQISYKPWKLKNKPTNDELYKEQLFKAYLYFFVLLVYLGVDERTLKIAFKFKNDINKDRVRSGY